VADLSSPVVERAVYVNWGIGASRRATDVGD
jgi:hypothetical protein